MTPDDKCIRVAVEGDGNHVATACERQTVRFEVFSARGMGRAAVEIPPEVWPSVLTLRLHLGGLESLRFRCDSYTIGVSVSSSAGHEVIETLNETEEITPDSPDWMVVTRTPHPDDALRARYFDVAAPAAFLTGGGRAFTFEWLDFYR